MVHPAPDFLARVELVEVPYGTLLRVARVGTTHPRRVGLHGLELGRHRVRVLTQADRIAVRLRHLASVETRDPGRGGQQHVGFRQDGASGAFEIAEQPLAVGERETGIAVEQRVRAGERGLVALLLVAAAQLSVQACVLRAEVLDRALGLGLEIRLTAIDEIEAPRDLARDLDVCDLVLAHGHVHRPVQQDVRALQQRIAEEAVGGEVLVLQLLLLVLVRRDALEPAERRDHRQQQVQFGVLRHARLDEERRHGRIESRGQPVDHDLPREVLDLAGVLVAGRECVVVGYEEIAVVFVLQLRPVPQRAVIIAEVQAAGRTHPREHAPRGGGS